MPIGCIIQRVRCREGITDIKEGGMSMMQFVIILAIAYIAGLAFRREE